jgi:citrate lyase subunit beta/citryl-CoA lyase
MNDIRARRSVLYVPATNGKAMAKSGELAADAIIYDLEDSVAPSAKAEARAALVAYFGSNPGSGKERVIRVNGSATEWGAADLQAAIACRPDAVLFPKVETAGQLVAARAALDASAVKIGLWAMIETPLGLVNIREIAALARQPGVRLDCFVAGTNDIAKETGLKIPEGRATMLLWLAQVILHAKAFGIDVIDGVYNDFRDIDGFNAECRQAVRMGFDGKTLIHPGQIEPANLAFSPDAATIEDARAIIDAFAQPENAGKGVLSINGRMVELLHADMAKRVLRKAGVSV